MSSDIYRTAATLTKAQRRAAKAARDRRDWINPLRNLTVERAIQLCEAYPRGDYADLMWTFGAPFVGVESTDPDYLCIIERRVAAVLEMDYDIKTAEDKGSSTRAKDQADALRNAYESIGNLYDAIEHLEMAVFRGFSLLEPLKTELRVIDHWNVRRDGSLGAWAWNPNAQSGIAFAQCVPLPADRIIARAVRRPIGRVALLKFIRGNLSEKDWDYWVEIYGIPSGIVTAPPDIDGDKLQAFMASAEAVSQGSSAALPNGSVYTPNSNPTGAAPFGERLEWLAQKLVLAGTGGLLTVLAQPGSGTLAGSAHMEAFKMLARSDARKISETLNLQYDAPRLRAAGLLDDGERPLAWFELAAQEEHSQQSATGQVVALSTSFAVDPAQVEEQTGWKVTPKPEPGAAAYPALAAALPPGPAPSARPESAAAGAQVASLLQIVKEVSAKQLPIEAAVQVIHAAFPRLAEERVRAMVTPLLNFTPAPIGDRADPTETRGPGPDEPSASDLAAAAEALSEDLAPLRDAIQDALSAHPGDLRAALSQIQAALPEIAARLGAGRLEDVIESGLAGALVSGIAETALETPEPSNPTQDPESP